MISTLHTPSPVQADEVQAATIARLKAYAVSHWIDLDIDPNDNPAYTVCENDWQHGPGVCVTDDQSQICRPCAVRWLWLRRGESACIEVMQVPQAGMAAAA